MARPSDPFRDFGILPADVGPPSGPVRSYFSPGRVVGQYIVTGIVAAIGLGLAVLFLLSMPLPLNLLGGAAAIGSFGTFVVLATRHDRRWVELNGTTLRAQHLYTGGIIERPIDDIESLTTIYHPVVNAGVLVMEKMWGRIKGVEIRFFDRRTPMRIMRFDPAMTNAKELIEAVMFRMSEHDEVDADIINLDGAPLVKQIRWKGEPPIAIPGNVLNVLLGCAMMLTLLFGGIGGMIAGSDSRTRALASVPPQQISVKDLIEKGPGDNRHVTLTDFRLGGYAFEAKGGTWRQVWIALYPQGDPGKEIRAILQSNQILNQTELLELARRGQVTGVCSASRRTWFGTVLGPQLQEANQGAELKAVWDIDELREVPSETSVQLMMLGAATLLLITIALTLILFWKAL